MIPIDIVQACMCFSLGPLPNFRGDWNPWNNFCSLYMNDSQPSRTRLTSLIIVAHFSRVKQEKRADYTSHYNYVVNNIGWIMAFFVIQEHLPRVRWDIRVDIILIPAAAWWQIFFKLHLFGQSIQKYFPNENSSENRAEKMSYIRVWLSWKMEEYQR